MLLAIPYAEHNIWPKRFSPKTLLDSLLLSFSDEEMETQKI